MNDAAWWARAVPATTERDDRGQSGVWVLRTKRVRPPSHVNADTGSETLSCGPHRAEPASPVQLQFEEFRRAGFLVPAARRRDRRRNLSDLHL